MTDWNRRAILSLSVLAAACASPTGRGDDGSSTAPDPTTTDTTDGETTSADSTGDTTDGASSSAGDTTTGGGAMACGLRCETAVDCCVLSGSFGCEDAIGVYPDNFVCGSDGTCSNHGCASTDDCSIFDSADVHFVCVTRDVFSTCEASCATDDDCFLAGPMYVCSGSDDAVGGYCRPPFGCTDDDECIGLGEKCEDGDCVFSCTTDEHCAGNGTCDVATGDCVCTDDDECPDGWGCATLGG